MSTAAARPGVLQETTKPAAAATQHSMTYHWAHSHQKRASSIRFGLHHGGGPGVASCGEQKTRQRWEADAAYAVSQAPAAAGIPATALVSGAGPREAADILTVAAAAAGTDCSSSAAVESNVSREEVQQLHSRHGGHPQSSLDSSGGRTQPAWANQQTTSTATDSRQLRRESHAQPTPAAAAAPDSSNKAGDGSSSSSSVRPGSAPCAMQPLASWQSRLAELEAACRNAEQLMLQAPTRAERSAALDLAGERER
jgi:hypothetical protein